MNVKLPVPSPLSRKLALVGNGMDVDKTGKVVPNGKAKLAIIGGDVVLAVGMRMMAVLSLKKTDTVETELTKALREIYPVEDQELI